jgi:hypothetical protein
MAQRGYSSVGRALPLHGKCQRFESAYLHNIKNNKFCLIQEIKGLWWIPWHSEAMKDVVTYDKLRGAGNKL